MIVFLSSFFIFVGSYSYNNITDEKEDIINRNGTNPMIKSRARYPIIIVSILLGLCLSCMLGHLPFAIASVVASTGLIYSALKIKRYLLVKNIYTGLTASMVFMIGATVSPFVFMMILYCALISLFIFIGSIVSDIRDYIGDKTAKLETLPVKIGYEASRRIALILLIVYSTTLIMFPVSMVLIPFCFLIFVSIYKNRIIFAHSAGSSAFLLMCLELAV